jgi:hypothetical protein
MNESDNLLAGLARVEEKLAALTTLVERFIGRIEVLDSRLRQIELGHVSKRHVYVIAALLVPICSVLLTFYLDHK